MPRDNSRLQSGPQEISVKYDEIYWGAASKMWRRKHCAVQSWVSIISFNYLLMKTPSRSSSYFYILLGSVYTGVFGLYFWNRHLSFHFVKFLSLHKPFYAIKFLKVLNRKYLNFLAFFGEYAKWCAFWDVNNI